MNLITGGTGSLGYEVTEQLLKAGESVVIFSRCELKQKMMAAHFQTSDLTFVVGDVRDRAALDDVMGTYNPRTVYHFAALKHVDILEDNPEESKKTNVDGSINVLKAARNNKVSHLVFTSTDKACMPVNAYGKSKGLAEDILLADRSPMRVAVARYGNVIGSRGSAVPYFIEAIKKNRPVTITDYEMTRFWITIEDAARFVIDCKGKEGAQIPTMKASKITEVVGVLSSILESDYETKLIGVRPGEKLHEDLTRCRNSKTTEQYTNEELKELLVPLCAKF